MYKAPAQAMSLFSAKRPAEKIHVKKKEVYTLEDRYNFQGMPISIENKAGHYRTGKDGDGHEWKTFMYYDYGYIRSTEAKDGEAVDVYINKAGRKSNLVHVIHQKKIEEVKQWRNGICPTCKKKHFKCKHAYDEDKVMLGFDYRDEAIKAYTAQYDSPLFLGPVSTYTIAEFKEHLKNSWGKKLPYNRLEKGHVVVKMKGPIDKKLKGLASKFGAVIEEEVPTVDKVWTCPHCKNKILEKSLFHRDNEWFHRCDTTKPIVLPKSDDTFLEKSYLGQPGDPRGSFSWLRENLDTVPASSKIKIKNKVTMKTHESYIKPTIDEISLKLEKNMDPYSVKKQHHTYSSDEDYMMNREQGETKQQYDWRMRLDARAEPSSQVWAEGVHVEKMTDYPHGMMSGDHSNEYEKGMYKSTKKIVVPTENQVV